MTKTIGYLTGAALLIAGASVYVRLLAWQHTHNPQPLILPILLRPGTISTPNVPISLTRNYDIVISLENSLRSDVGRRVDISWQLLEGTQSISEGNSTDKPWENWGGTEEKPIGEFRGEEGRVYRLALTVNSVAPEINLAKPTLRIQIPRGLWEDYGAGLFIRKSIAGLLGLIGIMIFGGTAFIKRSK